MNTQLHPSVLNLRKILFHALPIENYCLKTPDLETYRLYNYASTTTVPMQANGYKIRERFNICNETVLLLNNPKVGLILIFLKKLI